MKKLLAVLSLAVVSSCSCSPTWKLVFRDESEFATPSGFAMCRKLKGEDHAAECISLENFVRAQSEEEPVRGHELPQQDNGSTRL